MIQNITSNDRFVSILITDYINPLPFVMRKLYRYRIEMGTSPSSGYTSNKDLSPLYGIYLF